MDLKLTLFYFKNVWFLRLLHIGKLENDLLILRNTWFLGIDQQQKNHSAFFIDSTKNQNRVLAKRLVDHQSLFSKHLPFEMLPQLICKSHYLLGIGLLHHRPAPKQY